MEPESAPVIDPLSGASEVSDPLSSFSPASDPLSAALLDPLSQAVSEVSSFGASEKKKVRERERAIVCDQLRVTITSCSFRGTKKDLVVPDVTFEPWSVKRTAILSTYTTSEKIPITTVSGCGLQFP